MSGKTRKKAGNKARPSGGTAAKATDAKATGAKATAQPQPAQAAPAAQPAKAAPAARTATATIAVAPPKPWTAGPATHVAGTALGLFALGLVVGVGGAFLHEGWVDPGVRIPLGVIFALACTAAAGLAAGAVTRTRGGAVIAALGWTLGVLTLTTPRAEGDIIIGGGGVDYAFMLGGLVTQVLTILAVPFTSVEDGPTRAPA